MSREAKAAVPDETEELDSGGVEYPVSYERGVEMMQAFDDSMREGERLVSEYERKSRLGRFVMLRTNPKLKMHLRYKAAQESVRESRRVAAQEAGNIVYF